MRTLSEQIFEKYCTLRGYAFKRIDTNAREGPFPDYEVQTPRGAVICEVKEIEPNDEDKKFDEKLFQNDPRPCVLVIFAKTFHSYLTPGEIDAAMFGDRLVLFSTNPADHRRHFTRGGNRRLNKKRAVYVGALAVLRRGQSEGGVCLDIYHNAFVSNRISPAYFPDLQDRHYFKEGDPNATGHEWHEYMGSRNEA